MSDPFAVDVTACRGRQQRLLEAMQELNLKAVVIVDRANVQWLTGAYYGPLFRVAAAIESGGHVTLATPGKADTQPPAGLAADEIVVFEAQSHSTLRNDQGDRAAEALLGALKSLAGERLGAEFSCCGADLLAGLEAGEWVDVEALLYELRRRKDADELRFLRRAIAANSAMYARAREIIEPGLNEIDLYNELQATAVKNLGEPTTYFGQDFRCNARGGPPRDRACEAGELYILDLGVGFRGYYSDNCRTVAVGGEPSPEQQQAWEAICDVLQMVADTVRPGVSCCELFEKAQQALDRRQPWRFDHHLGHGVGLYPHEAPHLNPHWDDTFEVGDLFTAEPGLYHEDLRHGIRLEENYLVTESGVERLTQDSLELVSR